MFQAILNEFKFMDIIRGKSLRDTQQLRLFFVRLLNVSQHNLDIIIRKADVGKLFRVLDEACIISKIKITPSPSVEKVQQMLQRKFLGLICHL